MKESIESELLRLVNHVRQNKGQPALTALAGDLNVRSDLHFDSLDLAELTVRIEERFEVDVFEDGVVHRWGEIRARVARKIGQID
jgi:acyl carrier protein